VGVVTAVRGVHLSRAGSLEAIDRGKRELVESLPSSGWAILNADDPRVAAMAAHTAAGTLAYGFDARADVGAEQVVSHGPDGMSFRLRLPDEGVDVRTPVLGRHGVHNALAAAAVATCLGLDGASIAQGLSREVVLAHRSRLVAVGGWTILDDTYNASPDTVVAALDLLADLPGRHVAVLGEMLELGDETDVGHRRVGAHAARRSDHLVVVGEAAAGIADGARAAGMPGDAVVEVADRDSALVHLLSELRPGDSVLLKASRGVALDLLVEELLRAGGGGTSA
jgi:UDP-N-acetylmuramoyl-tripeptide--D-alanyl-D-alanine ligase